MSDDWKIRVKVEVNPEMEGTIGYGTLNAVGRVMELILCNIAEKERAYAGAWREQGWMGNLGRILSKTSRLKNMAWRDLPISNTEESLDETAQDLVAIAIFFLLNRIQDNRWGGR